MKKNPTKKFFSIRGDGTVPPGQPHGNERRGVALLIVLGMLVLLSVIVLAFVVSVTTDLADSKAYEGQTNTRLLADSAVNLVISEIRLASTAANQTWISQPGLLRTFDNTGAAVAAYKLYSSNAMIVNGAFDPNAGADLPSGNTWLNQPNLYTDLNSPVASGTTTTGSTQYIFPIIDGNNIKSFTLSGSTQLSYTTDGTAPTIEGFATDPTKVGISYNSTLALSATNNPVPMPVQWLYMLKDGTLISGTSTGGSKDVTFSGTLVPSGTNPIVARVAFWTDDETCKLDINTASEGTFWDTPCCVTQPNVANPGGNDPVGNAPFDPNQIFEWDLAQRQADRNEYQRYPGHPATTCLSPVLGDTIFKGLKLTAGSSVTGYGADYGYHTLTGSGWATFTEFINQLAPRISGSDAITSGSDYSSRGGTYRPGGSTLYSAGQSQGLGAGQPITPDQDRLYPTVDDYFYNNSMGVSSGTATVRLANGAAISGTVSASGTTVPVLTPALLEKARFFLTADNHSPEVNSFGMPRVCMWPITKNLSTIDNVDTSQSNVTSTMTAFDKVIAFDATVGGTTTSITNRVPFYFVRYDPYSLTNDFANSKNNQALYSYLNTYMKTAFPGMGQGTFAAKYPSEELSSGTVNQILTEMFDYVRTINLIDTSEDTGSAPFGAKSYTMVNQSVPWSDISWLSYTSQGEVVPIVIPTTAVSGTLGVTAGSPYTRGIGRIPTVGEMTLGMVKEDERMNNGVSESGTQGTITVTGTSTYAGTWTFKSAQPNMNNVLLKESTPGTVYTAPPKTPPMQDVLLVPGPGGVNAKPGTVSTAGTNFYDPRTQTKIQFVLMPYYFCPMAGYAAIGTNLRLHWTNVTLNAAGTSGTTPLSGTVAIAPSGTYASVPSQGLTVANGTYANGMQGQDLYDSGRIDDINDMECKLGGPMGAYTLIDPEQLFTTVPSNSGAPNDSMFQVLEAVVSGTSGPSFSGTSKNTMVISGSAVLQVKAPSITIPVNTWSQARGVTDQPTVIQTMTFSWPSITVQIPSLNNQTARGADPFVDLQSATTTLSNNVNTSQSLVVSGTASVKNGVSRMIPGNYAGGYSSNMLFHDGANEGHIVRSLQLSGSSSTFPNGSNTNSNIPIQGDFRLVAASAFISPYVYQPIQKYTASGTVTGYTTQGVTTITSGSFTPYFDTSKQFDYGWRTCGFFTQGAAGGGWAYAGPSGQLISTGSTGTLNAPIYADMRFAPYVPIGINGVYNYQGQPGDWDNGPGWVVDGAYCNKPDEGWIRHFQVGTATSMMTFVASSYAPFIGFDFVEEDAALGLPSLYAPNKMVSSPVMFGSLPTGVLAGHPWQTLKFSPAKSYLPGSNNHPGAGQPYITDGTIASGPYTQPPDHLLLDLFWMPVVDPYPISEPFATAGKVNLNYQIAPFTYITRKTALRGVLQSVKVTALNPTITTNDASRMGVDPPAPFGYPPQFSMAYKQPGANQDFDDVGDSNQHNGGGMGVSVRRNIDLDSTLKQIDTFRFGVPGSATVNKPFITASEICDIPLIPADLPTNNVANYNINTQIKGTTPSGYDAILATFWYGGGSVPTFGHRLTGDNMIERPYSMIYPRLTTKSNTYTVHVRVQSIKKSSTTPSAMFKDGQDQVVGEFRGSFLIERFLDPTTAGFYLNGNPSAPTTMNAAGAQLGPYKFRIISSKQFGQ